MQAGAVIFGQVAVAHRLNVFGQAVIPRADLAVLCVGHHGQTTLGCHSKHASHRGVIHHAVAVLGDKLDIIRQVQQMVNGVAVKVFGNGNGLVGITQANLARFLLHLMNDLCRRADRLGVGHQVDESISACRCSRRAGGNILFIFKAGGTPMAVGINKRGQNGQPFCIDHLACFRQVGSDCSNFAVRDQIIADAALVVPCIFNQHGWPSFWCGVARFCVRICGGCGRGRNSLSSR